MWRGPTDFPPLSAFIAWLALLSAATAAFLATLFYFMRSADDISQVKRKFGAIVGCVLAPTNFLIASHVLFHFFGSIEAANKAHYTLASWQIFGASPLFNIPLSLFEPLAVQFIFVIYVIKNFKSFSQTTTK